MAGTNIESIANTLPPTSVPQGCGSTQTEDTRSWTMRTELNRHWPQRQGSMGDRRGRASLVVVSCRAGVISKILMTFALLAGLVLSTTSPVLGATYALTDAVRMRSEPRAASPYSGVAAAGSSIALNCQQWGEAQGPNGNTLWLNVNGSGRNGWWVSDAWTTSPHLAADKTNGLAGVPWCGVAAPSPTGTSITANSPLYLCVNTANTGCRPVGMPSASAGQAATMKCWKKGSPANGTDMWFWVTGPFGEGYVNANVVRNQKTVGACDAIKAFVAAEAAIARNGQVWAGTADQGLFAASEWAPGPVGEWAGDCPKLPYVGWRAAGVTIPKRNAIDNYRSVSASVRPGVPPRGAVVFYDIAAPYGHEAISVGNGYVVTTRGLDNSKAANAVVGYNYFGSYLGWWSPA